MIRGYAIEAVAADVGECGRGDFVSKGGIVVCGEALTEVGGGDGAGRHLDPVDDAGEAGDEVVELGGVERGARASNDGDPSKADEFLRFVPVGHVGEGVAADDEPDLRVAAIAEGAEGVRGVGGSGAA